MKKYKFAVIILISSVFMFSGFSRAEESPYPLIFKEDWNKLPLDPNDTKEYTPYEMDPNKIGHLSPYLLFDFAFPLCPQKGAQ